MKKSQQKYANPEAFQNGKRRDPETQHHSEKRHFWDTLPFNDVSLDISG